MIGNSAPPCTAKLVFCLQLIQVSSTVDSDVSSKLTNFLEKLHDVDSTPLKSVASALF